MFLIKKKKNSFKQFNTLLITIDIYNIFIRLNNINIYPQKPWKI